MLEPSEPPAVQTSQHQQWWDVWRHRLSPRPGANRDQATCPDHRNLVRAEVAWAGKGYLIFRPGEILLLITTSSLQLRGPPVKRPVLFPQGLLPLLLVAFPNAQPSSWRSQCYMDKTGASQKNQVCQHQRQVFSSASTPHLEKQMALITALPPFFIFKHKKILVFSESKAHSAACREFSSLSGQTLLSFSLTTWYSTIYLSL